MKINAKNPIVTIVIGVIAIAAGVFLHFNQQDFLENAKETTGTIIDVQEKYSTSSSNSNVGRNTHNSNERQFHPVIRFGTETGDTVTFQSVKGSKHRSAYTVGDEIAVLYNPDKPVNAQIKVSGMQNTSLIVAGAGLAFILIGIFNRKKQKATNIR